MTTPTVLERFPEINEVRGQSSKAVKIYSYMPWYIVSSCLELKLWYLGHKIKPICQRSNREVRLRSRVRGPTP